ncbi:unnamed protein product, partial [Scytosiphon promiscuus]
LVTFSFLVFSVLRGQGAEITVSPGGFQDALDDVSPGDTILLEDGEYWESVKTHVDGTASEPITVRGAGGTTNNENVVLHGSDVGSRVFEIRHDYYIIEDFTIDGDASSRTDSDDIMDLNRDKLIFATGVGTWTGREPTTRSGGYRSALDGLVVRNMRLINAGGECVRLKDFVTFADIYSNHISDCGEPRLVHSHDDGGKNGEGVYIGTSVDQWDDGNWSDDPDECQGNSVRQNYIKTRGNEGVDIKEGSYDTLVEENSIYMQHDDDSGGDRGDRSIIRDNYIEDTDGAGVRLGGYEVDGDQYGLNNEVYGNTLVDCRHSGVKIMASPQGQICGNTIELPSSADADDVSTECGGFYRIPHEESSQDLTRTEIWPEKTCETTRSVFVVFMKDWRVDYSCEMSLATIFCAIAGDNAAPHEPVLENYSCPFLRPKRNAPPPPSTAARKRPTWAHRAVVHPFASLPPLLMMNVSTSTPVETSQTTTTRGSPAAAPVTAAMTAVTTTAMTMVTTTATAAATARATTAFQASTAPDGTAARPGATSAAAAAAARPAPRTASGKRSAASAKCGTPGGTATTRGRRRAST